MAAEKDQMKTAADTCVPCGEGFLNIRAGAIILKDGRFLMVGNDRFDYLYSVGGRLHFGETAEQAVLREVEEETGVRLEVDRLGFIHEDIYTADVPGREGKTIYEISFYFYMKVPEDFDPRSDSATEFGDAERLVWVSPDDDIPMFPTFFPEELKNPSLTMKHIVTDERK